METAQRTQTRPKVRWTLSRRENLEFYLFISPWLVGFILFIMGPMIATILLALTDWDLLSQPKFVALDNYTKLITADPVFWKSLQVTAIYSFAGIPLQMALALFLAILLNQRLVLLPVIRTIYYLPSVISGVAVAILWLWIFNPDFGAINVLLSKVGIEGPLWLASEQWALPALIIMGLWGVGGAMVIYLAGLQGIPTDLYEAANIDGANTWQQFRYVTIPMMSPVILFNLVMGIINSFQSFTYAYVMTRGGPNYATMMYVLYLYQNAFQYFQMGYASALAWVLFLIILVLTLLVFKSSPLWVYYEGQLRSRR